MKRPIKIHSMIGVNSFHPLIKKITLENGPLFIDIYSSFDVWTSNSFPKQWVFSVAWISSLGILHIFVIVSVFLFISHLIYLRDITYDTASSFIKLKIWYYNIRLTITYLILYSWRMMFCQHFAIMAIQQWLFLSFHHFSHMLNT